MQKPSEKCEHIDHIKLILLENVNIKILFFEAETLQERLVTPKSANRNNIYKKMFMLLMERGNVNSSLK